MIQKSLAGLLAALAVSALTAAPSIRRVPEGRGDSVVAGRAYQGEELACDLPGSEHIKNIGSKIDRRGMCVFSSVEMAARAQGLEQMRGFRDWCAAHYPGGGWPEKVDKLIAAWCDHGCADWRRQHGEPNAERFRNMPIPPYVQYEGRDPAPVLERCDRTGRLPTVTYGYSPRYGGTIAHVTNAAKFGGKWGVCLDNNFPGEQSYEWMPLPEFVRRIKHPSGSAWLFVWLAPPYALPPHN
jgi:hypothetical protein